MGNNMQWRCLGSNLPFLAGFAQELLFERHFGDLFFVSILVQNMVEDVV